MIATNSCTTFNNSDKKFHHEVIELIKQSKSFSENQEEQKLDLLLKAASIARKHSDDYGLDYCLYNATFIAGIRLKNFEQGLALSDESLVIAHKIGHPNNLTDAYTNRALIFQLNDMLDSATFYNKIALAYFDQDESPFDEKNWSLFNNVAALYSMQNNTNLAIEYTLKYLNDYALKVKDTSSINTAYNNLGLYYSHSNKFDSAA